MRRKTYALVAPHDCYQQRFVYNAHKKEWQCPICHIVYTPPLDKHAVPPSVKLWKPWLLPVPPFDIEEWNKL